MAQLSISLLGSLQIAINGKPVEAFKSSRTRALLAFLAVEGDRPHRRETLAGLLWPDWPDREALNNLRSTLSNLRLAIIDRDVDPPFLLISRETIQINPQADIWLDVAEFTKAADAIKAGSPINDALEHAVSLYRGDFLKGFSITDNPEFEEWGSRTREQLAHIANSVLQTLAFTFETNKEYSRALTYAWQRIEMDPLDETAHQQIMRLLALSGNRAAALTQYETCIEVLSTELGVEPTEETTRLFEQIRAGKLKFDEPSIPPSVEPTPSLPSFLQKEPPHFEIPVFVSREYELAQLDKFLTVALSGHGQVVFVTGEPGSGKTSLLQEFSQRAQVAHADLCVASGNCNAYTGIGDPYLPFREILDLLTGKVETRLAAGAITREHALRLWNALPDAVQALVAAGPDLIDTFILRGPLLERTLTHTPGKPAWLTRLIDLLERQPVLEKTSSVLQPRDFFDQYTTVLQILARQRPMILVLDDLQWADLGSISLLFHLGRRLSGHRILLLGTFRPEEISISKDENRNPIESVINEFRRIYGDLEVNLDRAENREFVDALVDTEPNHLGPTFRTMVYQQTGGNPLFTVELLRGMQEHGDLIKDADQGWIESSTLDWNNLPARVEAVIKERINRLPRLLQRTLAVASVEGEVFTAEVIAKILGENEREMVQLLSSELVRKHRLASAQTIERLGLQRISHYRFRSYLIQKYLYDGMDYAERAYLHEAIGDELEELYGEQASEIAVQLARHYQEARNTTKAIQYLQQAGDRAIQLSGYQEAISHITNALELLTSLPDPNERANLELDLQISLAKASFKEVATPGWKEILTKARELSQQTGNRSHLHLILGELSVYYYVRGELRTAYDLAEEALQLSQLTGNSLDAAIGNWFVAFILIALGKLSTARTHLEQVLSVYQPGCHKEIVALRGSDAGLSGMAYYACCLWCLGYPDQAEKYAQEALSLAHTFGHTFSTVEVLCYAGCMMNMLRRDWQIVKQYSEEMLNITTKNGFFGWHGGATSYYGHALSMQGDFQKGIPLTQHGITTNDKIEEYLFIPGHLQFLAQAHQMSGDLEEGLATLNRALAMVEQTEERFWEAEIYRVKGQLLLAKNELGEAEASLLKAIEIARQQEAKSWELRAAIDLCRLWQSQGKTEEAFSILANVFNWFTEGFETADLIEAQKLLRELSQKT